MSQLKTTFRSQLKIRETYSNLGPLASSPGRFRGSAERIRIPNVAEEFSVFDVYDSNNMTEFLIRIFITSAECVVV